MKAKEIMTSPAITVREDDTIEHAARTMVDKHLGGLPVVDGNGDVVGFVTDSDFAAKRRGVPFSLVMAPQILGEWVGADHVERIYQAARDRKIKEIMSKPPITARPDDTLETIVKKLLEYDVNRVVVTDGRRPLGVIARHDLLRLALDGVGR